MRATFSGFEIAKSGLQAAQMGLDVTGQNMSRVNAEGYSRQTVSQTAVHYDAISYKYKNLSTGNLGLGVSVDNIVRVRDDFLDVRFRSANSDSAVYSKTTDILRNIEDIFDETTKDGLGVMLQDFYSSLQSLSANTGDVEFAGLVRASAQKITQTLNFYSKQLDKIREQEISDLSTSIDDVNVLLKKINEMNTSIQVQTIQKNVSNELLDERNLYLDQLSKYLNITTATNEDGTISVLCGSQYLVDPTKDYVAKVSYEADPSYGALNIITEEGKLDIISGAIKGSLDALNGKGTFAVNGENEFYGIPYYQDALDAFASAFANTFNKLNGEGKPLFTGNTAKTIQVSKEWLKDANFITTTADEDAQDGKNDNIAKMLYTFENPISISDSFTGTFDEFVLSLMSRVSVDVGYYSDLSKTADAVLTSADNQREAIKGVSINEETVNLIKYQKAFEACAKVITALDEMLDTIINGMGRVGR